MNKYNNPRLLNTVVSGTGMKNPVRPHVIIGSEENGFIRGDLMDANAIQELIVTEIAAREHGDEELTEYIDEKVQLAVDDLVDGAPEVLDTLKELSEALGDDANFATTITEKIASKVDKVEGKGLSTNDYTTAEKQKLAGIAAGAEVNVQSDWNVTNSSNDAFIKNKPTKLSLFTNDVPYVMEAGLLTVRDGINDRFSSVEDGLAGIKSYIDDLNEEVVLTETTDPANGHAYVDLGLPSGTLWATMNVGATKESDYGLYFAWGETQGYTASQVGSGEGQKYFGWADYKYGNSTSSSDAVSMTKYNSTDGKTVLDIEDDAAHVNWGGDWHMPNRAQCIELFKETKNGFVTNAGAFKQYAWSDTDGVSNPTSTTATISNWDTAGYFFFKNSYTSVTDAISAEDYLFIPAAGRCEGGKVNGVGKYGNVLASALRSESVESAWYFYFGSGKAGVLGGGRCNGRSVRGVLDKDAQGETITTPVKEVVTDLKSNEEVIAAALNNLNTKIEATNIRIETFEDFKGSINEEVDKNRQYMDSSMFVAIFREADADRINYIIDNFAPTFYVKDSSNDVAVCSVVRSATQVCVFRNAVDEQSGAAIQGFRQGTIKIDGTIEWHLWTLISSTVPSIPA